MTMVNREDMVWSMDLVVYVRGQGEICGLFEDVSQVLIRLWLMLDSRVLHPRTGLQHVIGNSFPHGCRSGHALGEPL